MYFSSNTLNVTDPAAMDRDRGLADEPWGPLSDADDDGCDHATEVDPEI